LGKTLFSVSGGGVMRARTKGYGRGKRTIGVALKAGRGALVKER